MFRFSLYTVMYGRPPFLVFLGSTIILFSLMILVTLPGPSPSNTSRLFSRRSNTFIALFKPSSTYRFSLYKRTTDANSITLPPDPSSPIMALCYACHAPTHLRKTVGLSASFAQSTKQSALFYSTHTCHRNSGLKHSLRPLSSLIDDRVDPVISPHHLSFCSVLLRTTRLYESSAAYVTPTPRLRLRTNSPLVLLLPCSSGTLRITRDSAATASHPNASSCLGTSTSMKQFFRFSSPCNNHHHHL